MIGAIIQARMNSSRLPGKVLLSINGRPVIDYLFSQLKRVGKLDIIVLATSSEQADDPIVEYAESHGHSYYRGSEHDVLERFYFAAKEYKIEHVIRITGDCPLQDPAIINLIIESYLNENPDYVITGPTFAEGLDCELFSFKALEEAHKEARLVSEREHLTQFFVNHPERYRKIILENETDDSRYRFTLDETDDFEVLKAIIKGLALKELGNFTSENIKQFLDQNEAIFAINSKIIRNEGLAKSLANDKEIF
jgi:spore coat polysaccharide biosynthesis protein SpsF